MRIKYTDYIDRPKVDEIEDFVGSSLTNTWDISGATESASYVAQQSARAIGRLCNVLAQKGLLSGNDISFIADGFISGSAELLKDEDDE